MSPEIKEKWDAHIYQMEKSSFLLDTIRAHVSVILTTDANSGSMSDTCVILGGVSPQYCDFILKMREKYPDHDLEMLSMEIYDRIFSRDYKSTAKFQAFFETPLNQWYELRKKQRQLFSEKNVLDSILSDAKHAYYSVYGKDIEWREIQEKPEQKQQETEPVDEDDTAEMIDHINRQEARDELVCRMFREGAIPEDVALEYVGGDLDHDSFMKLVGIYTEQETETEPETEEKDFDYFGYYKKETEAKMICKMYREGIIDEKVALEYLDEPDWSHDTFQRIVDNFSEKEKEERVDDK